MLSEQHSITATNNSASPTYTFYPMSRYSAYHFNLVSYEEQFYFSSALQTCHQTTNSAQISPKLASSSESQSKGKSNVNRS